jgi:hypothetical protein
MKPLNDKSLLTFNAVAALAFITVGVILTATAPPPKLFTFGASQTPTAAEDLAVGRAWMATTYTKSVLIPQTETNSNIYTISSPPISETLTTVANLLQVEGELYSETYTYDDYSYTDNWWGKKTPDGMVDYTQPNITAYQMNPDSIVFWNYNEGWNMDMAVSSDMETPTPAPLAPALEKVNTFLTSLNYNPAEYNITHNTIWGLNITAELLIENQPSPLTYSFGFNPDGTFNYVSGFAGTLTVKGNYPALNPYLAADRANNWIWYAQAAPSIYEAFYLSQPEPEPVTETITGLYIDTINPTTAETLTETLTNIIVEPFTVEPYSETSYNIIFTTTPTMETLTPIIDTLTATTEYNTVEPNITYDYPNIETPSTIMLTDYQTIWTLIYDNEGNAYITGGYAYTSSEDPYTFITVMNVPENLISIPDNMLMRMEPAIEPYMDTVGTIAAKNLTAKVLQNILQK